MEAKYPEVTIMETVCAKLKRMHHPDEPWIACHTKIAKKVTQLKKMIRLYYPEVADTERLRRLRDFTDQDLEEALSLSETSATNPKNIIEKYGLGTDNRSFHDGTSRQGKDK